ncbi:MAG TPA: glutaredoxin family protein [Candidatus Omnitrophota bacterium]|nr:glutaredoxin family protein [Candidatus Omnitrophota bacterium]
MIEMTHVDGADKGKIVLYALSTCIWCKKTRKLLNELKVAYDFVEVDLLEGKDGDDADAVVQKWNAAGTYPTMVINDKTAITGYNPDAVKKALG